MKDIFVDVQMEFDAVVLNEQPDPARYVIEAARSEAEALCEQQRAHLRTDRAPELVVERAQRKDTGALVVLVASRWAVVAPEFVQERRGVEPIPAQAEPLGRYSPG